MTLYLDDVLEELRAVGPVVVSVRVGYLADAVVRALSRQSSESAIFGVPYSIDHALAYTAIELSMSDGSVRKLDAAGFVNP